MVNPVGQAGPAPIETMRTAAAGAVRSDARPVNARGDAGATPAARLARLGPPIDVNRVSEIRAAIANGNYAVDADRLAAAMLALDLPVRSA